MFKTIEIGSNNTKIYSFLRFLLPRKEKKIFFFHKYYIKSSVLYFIFQNLITLTFINWISQGIQGMSKSEAIFHIISGFIVFWPFFIFFQLNILNSILLAHTINWIFNTHFWVFFRFFNIRFNKAQNYYKYIEQTKKRMADNKCFKAIYLIGGPARNKELSDFSDLDIKFVLKDDFVNVIIGNIILIFEKIRSFFLRIPLDANIYSMKQIKNEIDSREKAIELFIAK
ncbi:MAG: hypothetical protein JXB17_11950 [Bacteroidales bacterium]|nr:hypothetical protein [Bacteroidales bacterium]